MAKKLHVDIETFSSIDIKSSGHYKYLESPDFEILMVAYAFDNDPIEIIDLAQGESLPAEFIQALQDPTVEKWAHNATFERNAFKKIGYDIPAEQWYCTQVKAGFCGWPLSLDMISKAMQMEDNGKLTTGKALIRYFCCPVKPTATNGMRCRNFPKHDIEKWEEFKLYCIGDVRAERFIEQKLDCYEIPQFERDNYILDQKINDRGILIDLTMAANAIAIDKTFTKDVKDRLREITGVDNPNSPAQLKDWLSEFLQKDITSLAKGFVSDLIDEIGEGPAGEVLKLRQKISKTSIKKYTAMIKCACEDSRGRGLLQFYGGARTGRWAGRLIQLQNLVKNKMAYLEQARDAIAAGDYDLITLLYDDIADVLSQLIRTAFIPRKGTIFAVADFSSIEAYIIAWLSGEQWRLDVFATHGKIYEASAAAMFNIPIESIKKGSNFRDKGKIAELALGYQGAVGALDKMGADKMGLSYEDKTGIVKRWRKASPCIVEMWDVFEKCAIRVVKTRKPVTCKFKDIIFDYDGEAMTIQLPSGRKLYYQKPILRPNKWGKDAIRYMGINQDTKQWGYIDTYGGKITENVVQAIARDALALALIRLDKLSHEIVMHVHDEAILEIPKHGIVQPEQILHNICEVMAVPIPWAPGLNLKAEGYNTKFYKKD